MYSTNPRHACSQPIRTPAAALTALCLVHIGFNDETAQLANMSGRDHADLRRLLKKLLAQFEHPDHPDCPRSTQLGKSVRPGTKRAASECSQRGSAPASQQRAERAAVLIANTRSDRIRR